MTTSQQQGDANEAYFQDYIEKAYSQAKPQFIDHIKYDGIHGFDKAFVMNEHLHLCIAEVKSRYSRLGKGQMSKQWIIGHLQKLQTKSPNHPLLIAIQQVIKNNGLIYACTYRVNPNSVNKNPVQFTKGSVFFTADELKKSLTIASFPHFINPQREGNSMSISYGNRATQFHLDSLETLDKFKERLEQFKENLEQELFELENYYSQLADNNEWNDIKHAEYGENYMSVIRQHIQFVSHLLEDESMDFIHRYHARAEELGITY